MSRMSRRLHGRKGQSIVEYLVIVTLIIVAIFTIKGAVKVNMDTLFTNAATQTATAGATLNTAVPE